MSLASVTLALNVYYKSKTEKNLVAFLWCNNMKPAIQVNISNCAYKFQAWMLIAASISSLPLLLTWH